MQLPRSIRSGCGGFARALQLSRTPQRAGHIAPQKAQMVLRIDTEPSTDRHFGGPSRRSPVLAVPATPSPTADRAYEPVSASPLLRKAEPCAVPSQEQGAAIHCFYSILVGALHGSADVDQLQAALQQQIVSAANPELLHLWPFPPIASGREHIVSVTHNAVAVLHAAFHMHKLEAVLPLLLQLLQHVQHMDPTISGSLMNLMRLLAEVYDTPPLSDASKGYICSLLGLWGLTPREAQGGPTVWSSSTAGSCRKLRIFPSQRLARPCCSFSDISPHAAVQLPHGPESEITAATDLNEHMLPKKPSAVRQRTAEEVALAETDDLVALPAQAYAMVMNAPVNKTPKELQPRSELMTKAAHRAVLSDLGYGPYGWRAIKAYMASRTNTYQFDFNQEVRLRRLRAEAVKTASQDELYRSD